VCVNDIYSSQDSENGGLSKAGKDIDRSSIQAIGGKDTRRSVRERLVNLGPAASELLIDMRK
jgi:hypothetical protein